jgi:hypothetical protein
MMLRKRIIYFLLFIFLTWLALATRHHPQWFHPIIAEYGGDIIWSGMFLFFLRAFFLKTALWKLALISYGLGVADEASQLYHAPWIESIRRTTTGHLLLGDTFVWSDIICYAIGILLAFIIILILERTYFNSVS